MPNNTDLEPYLLSIAQSLDSIARHLDHMAGTQKNTPSIAESLNKLSRCLDGIYKIADDINPKSHDCSYENLDDDNV